MNNRQNGNYLIAATIQKILNQRFQQSTGGKSLICLEGFSHNVYEKLKNLFSQEADVFLAGEAKGEELVSLRNNPDSRKPLVIFIGAYFPESQSLQHFSRITPQMILENENFRENLIELTFKGFHQLDVNLIKEAVKKMINILQPSLEAMAEYLFSVRENVPNEKQENNKDFIYKQMGKALWRLGIFSYEDLITRNIKNTPSSTSEKLKKNYETYLKHNLQYASPGYRSRFTYESFSDIKEPEKRKLLFDYKRNKNIDECLKGVDFEDVKSILKRPKRISRSNADEIGSEETEKNILIGILKRFSGKGTYSLTFGDAQQFDISLESLPLTSALEPVGEFKKWNMQLNKAIEIFNSKGDANIDEEDPTIEITVTLSELNKPKTKGIFFFSLKGLDFNKKPISLSHWHKLVENTNDRGIKEAVTKFLKSRDEIINEISSPIFLTLPIDIKTYIDSYLRLLILLWRKTPDFSQFEWFRDLLKDFIYLDMEPIDKEEELEMMPPHPYCLFKRRIMELMILELLEKSSEKKKSYWTEKEEKEEKDKISKISDLLDEIFVKCWPRYLGKEEGKPPLQFNTGDSGTRYKTREHYLPVRSMLSQTLTPQIEHYVKENPLASHGLRLNVLNPHDGKDLFNAIDSLYKKYKKDKKGNMQNVPHFVSLTAIGPNESETMSHFDNKVEKQDKEEVDIFLKQPDTILPFCRYEKQLIKKKEEWILSWLKESKEQGKNSDIFFAVDPFWHRFGVKDDIMSSQEIQAIDRYFQDFEEDNLEEDNLTVLDFLTGPDRIYLRKALEAFSIMVIKRSGEKRTYEEKTIDFKDYVALVERMKESSEWAIVQDHNVNDYYAQELADLLAEKIGDSVSTLVQDSTQGGIYLFITPSQEKDVNKLEKGIPDYLKKDKHFKGWMATVYGNFIEADNFAEIFFQSSYQWLIPLNMLPVWFSDFFIDDENTGNGDATDEAENALQDKESSDYLVRLIFKPEENTDIYFDIHFYKLEDKKLTLLPDEEEKEIKNDFSNFIRINKGDPGDLFSRLKRKILYKVLLTLITNPYQAWFLALLFRENVNFISNPIRKMADKDNSTGKLKIWELRRLTTHLIRLYSDKPAISFDLTRTLTSFFSHIESKTPGFLKRCLMHLNMKNSSFFEDNYVLKKYLK